MKGGLQFVVILGLIASLFFNFYLFKENKKLTQGMKIIAVLDGDTILLENKVRVRLRQIDAPELKYCGGNEAKELLTKLVLNKNITLTENILDQQGRPMALIYVGNKIINQQMLESGWVRFHHDQTFANEELKKIAEKIKNDKKGIYSEKCYQTENKENPKCNIKGNVDKNSTKRLYYYPGCVNYKFTIVEKDIGESWFCTEKEAEAAGFTKSKTCR